MCNRENSPKETEKDIALHKAIEHIFNEGYNSGYNQALDDIIEHISTMRRIQSILGQKWPSRIM